MPYRRAIPDPSGYDFTITSPIPRTSTIDPLLGEPPIPRDMLFAASPPTTPRAGRATRDGQKAKGGGAAKPPPLIHPDLKVKTTDPPGVASLKNKIAERQLSNRLSRERAVSINLRRGKITEEEAAGLIDGSLTGAALARRRLLKKNLERGLISPEQYDRLIS